LRTLGTANSSPVSATPAELSLYLTGDDHRGLDQPSTFCESRAKMSESIVPPLESRSRR
jgi:hypothetical protein